MNSAVSIGEPWMWGAFSAFVLVMLALDLSEEIEFQIKWENPQ